MTIVLVEQNLKKALELAQRGYVIETGRITVSGSSADLTGNDAIRAAYLGL
jgi:branched-chain amino acid transport system ATP-binding protein